MNQSATDFANELIAAIGAERVLTSNEALERASKDETHGLKPVLPLAVIFVNSHEDVVKTAEICTKFNISMSPRGTGTGKSGGCVPSEGGVVVDFSKFNQIVSVDLTDLVAVVEPGVLLGEFQKHVESMCLFYPPDPASLEWCTIGGNIAENAGGASAVKYGVTKDYVLGMRIVLADGRNFRVGKRTIKGVTGLDLASLLCGSEGILAFVTEVTLRLLPKPRFVMASMLRFSSRDQALLAVPKVRNSGAVPKCIEFMDSSSLEALRISGFIKDWPEDIAALLLVEVDGNDEDKCVEALSLIERAVPGEGYLGASVAVNEKQRQELWNIRRQLSEATKRLAKHKISEDIVVPLSKMSELLKAVEVISAKYGVRTCSFGHAGDGNLHVQFLFDEENIKLKIPQILNDVFIATIDYGGTLTGEHGIGIAKQPYLALEQEAGLIDLQKQLKSVFDPRGLLNPGKVL